MYSWLKMNQLIKNIFFVLFFPETNSLPAQDETGWPDESSLDIYWNAFSSEAFSLFETHRSEYIFRSSLFFSFPPTVEPLEIELKIPKEPLTAGKRSDMVCRSSGSRPPASITWYIDGIHIKKVLVKNLVSDDGNVSTSILSYLPRKEDHNKFVSCRANNPTYGSSSSSLTSSLSPSSPTTSNIRPLYLSDQMQLDIHCK